MELERQGFEGRSFSFTLLLAFDKLNLMIGYLYVAIAGSLAGLVVFGGQVLRNLGLSAVEISIIPYILSALFLLPFLIAYRLIAINKKALWPLVLWGVVATGSVIGQYFSLYFGIPVAIVVLLLYSQPLWTTLICRFVFKEKINVREISACIIVLLGIITLVNPLAIRGNYSPVGIALALFGGLSLSGWIIGGSLLGKKGNHPLNSQFWGLIFGIISFVVLLPFFRLAGMSNELIGFSLHFSTSAWIVLILFSLLAVNLCHVFYLLGSKRIPTVHAGIMMLLEPVVGSILASIFLDQPLTFNIIIGGIMILIANYLVVTSAKEENII